MGGPCFRLEQQETNFWKYANVVLDEYLADIFKKNLTFKSHFGESRLRDFTMDKNESFMRIFHWIIHID